MKPPKPKVHKIDVDEPLLSFHKLTMRCGVTLQTAAPQFMFVDALIGEMTVNFSNLCRKCEALVPTGDAKRHYIYGMTEAQEDLDRESEEN